jgi:S-formylglutathione hydrolase FrmB
MNGFFWVVSLWVDGFGLGQVPPILLGPNQVQRVNRSLHGQLLAFTCHSGVDHRIWSPALNQPRGLLVYLPPGYDPKKQYPLALFLHGAAQDEQFFLQALAVPFDQAIARGQLPPVIIAAPNGSIHGKATMYDLASFWADTKAGLFERYLMVDVWDFLHANFSIHPGRDYHALLGVSMGGSAAMRLGIQYRDRFRCIVSVMPLLDLRYSDCRGRYRSRFDPACYSLIDTYRGHSPLGRRRLFVLRNDDLYRPLFGSGPEAVAGMSRLSPLELMEREGLRPGELEIYIGYGARDEFNVAAHVESFMYAARRRGIEITVDRDPQGRHDLSTGLRLLPRMAEWASKRVPRGE